MILDSISLSIPSPIEQISSPFFSNSKIKVFVKREDLIHPEVSGNKWRKLKYNLIEAKKTNKDHLVSFGGAFSNHIHALSAAARLLGLRSTVFVRGSFVDPHNPTLLFAQANGTQIIHIPKEEYKLKEDSELFKKFINETPQAFIIPEGGSNKLALEGVKEMMEEISNNTEINPSHILVSAGTGATAMGILNNANADVEVVIFNTLNNPSLNELLSHHSNTATVRYQIKQDYNFGGFAKVNVELVDFINAFKQEFDISLDPIYNAKMFYGFLDLVKNNYFKANSEILLIHTGGLQGITAHNYRYRNKDQMLIQ